MATTTPNYGWPVPTSTDLVKDGATAIEDLGDAIDATVFGLPGSGLTLIKQQTVGTAVSTVTVTGAFSATYDAYKIIISGGAASVSDAVNIQFGSTITGYYSARPRVTLATGAISANATVNGTSLQFGSCNTSGFVVNVDIMNPYLTTLTQCSVPFWGATTAIIDQTFGFLNNSTSYTAFTLTPTSGTWTGGTIYVYGYNK